MATAPGVEKRGATATGRFITKEEDVEMEDADEMQRMRERRKGKKRAAPEDSDDEQRVAMDMDDEQGPFSHTYEPVATLEVKKKTFKPSRRSSSPLPTADRRTASGGKKEEILGKDLLELEPSGGMDPDEDAWFNFYVLESNNCEGMLPPASTQSTKQKSTGETYAEWKKSLPGWQRTQLDRFTRVLLSKPDRYQTTRNLSAVRKALSAMDIPQSRPKKILLNLWILALGLLGADQVVMANLPPGGFRLPDTAGGGNDAFHKWKNALARRFPDASFESTSIYGSGNATFGLRNIEGIYEAFPSASTAVLLLPTGSTWSQLYQVLNKKSKDHEKIPGSGHIQNCLPGRFLAGTTEEFGALLSKKSMTTKGANKGLRLLGLTWDQFRGAIEGGWEAGGFPADFVAHINEALTDDIEGPAASEHLLCKPSRHDWASFKRMTFYRTAPRIFNTSATVWTSR
ncbi:hypothetical protein RQP46_010556 [Phenoliferia psychrophenolica]